MDFLEDPTEVVSFASIVFLFLLDTHHVLLEYATATTKNDEDVENSPGLETLHFSDTRIDMVTRETLHHFRLHDSLAAIDVDLGFWVKLRSTTWFSKFLLNEYDDNCWI